MIANVKKLDSDKLLQKVLEPTQFQFDILELNKSQLYEQGIRSDGSFIGYYSAFTIRRKVELGARYDHITLNDTGEFYQSFKFGNGNDAITISADTEKPDVDLAQKYGNNILGLSDDNKQQTEEWIIPGLRDEILKQIRS